MNRVRDAEAYRRLWGSYPPGYNAEQAAHDDELDHYGARHAGCYPGPGGRWQCRAAAAERREGRPVGSDCGTDR